MSQGTYTFLACFSGFWLVWAVVVMLCCFCSFLQRRLKRRREERRREQCLRAVEMEPLHCHPAGHPPPPPPPLPPPPQLPREPPQFCPPALSPPPPPPLPLPVPHPMPQANWVSVAGNWEGRCLSWGLMMFVSALDVLMFNISISLAGSLGSLTNREDKYSSTLFKICLTQEKPDLLAPTSAEV